MTLLGDPVAHSLSPRLQNAAFRAAGVDGVYVALHCHADGLPGLLRGIARAGGGGNVTIPHKLLAARLIEKAAASVNTTGACNTFWLEDGRICGENTDVAGFAAAARQLLGTLAGARVLLLGAGGAARAALSALLAEGADAIVLLNRTPSRAQALRAELALDHHRVQLAAPPAERLDNESFDLVVNATPLGMTPQDPLAFPLERLRQAGAALDLVYSPAETPWVHYARQLGIPAADGLEMLIQQGAASFQCWWRMPAPLEAMRAAVPHAAMDVPR